MAMPHRMFDLTATVFNATGAAVRTSPTLLKAIALSVVTTSALAQGMPPGRESMPQNSGPEEGNEGKAEIKKVPLSSVQITMPAKLDAKARPQLPKIDELLPIPLRTRPLAAVTLSVLFSGGIENTVMNVCSADGEMYEVARVPTGRRSNLSCGVVLAVSTSDRERSIRVFSMEQRLKVPLPLNRGPDIDLLICSRPLAAQSNSDMSRLFKDFGAAGNTQLVTVDDCNGDHQEDILLVHSDGAGCLLLSGSNLETLKTLPATPELDGPQFTARLGDMDGDLVGEVMVTSLNGDRYYVVSPKSNTVLFEQTLDKTLQVSGGVRSLCSLGLQEETIESVGIAFVFQDENEKDATRIAAINVRTGQATFVGDSLEGALRFGRKMASGHIAGDKQRLWLAFSCDPDGRRMQTRVRIQEVGIAGSIVEVIMPQEAFLCGFDLCATSSAEIEGDCLGVTIAPRPGVETSVTCDPVVFIDVAKCFNDG